MSDRATLHWTRVDDFGAYCCGEHGYRRLPLKSPFEVLRIQRGTEAPLVFYRRLRTDHATATGAGEVLVEKYIRHCRKLEAARG